MIVVMAPSCSVRVTPLQVPTVLPLAQDQVPQIRRQPRARGTNGQRSTFLADRRSLVRADPWSLSRVCFDVLPLNFGVARLTADPFLLCHSQPFIYSFFFDRFSLYVVRIR